MKYSDDLCEWLVSLGYTHCFYVAGGNIMHLLDSASQRFTCIPVIHEVSAGIAVEYFNELSEPGKGRAFALVTAGPGLTNIVTAMAGAFAESRELLVLGGQVKTSDLKSPELRQRGIQELDGISVVKSISKIARRYDCRYSRSTLFSDVKKGFTGRKGPVFLEICLDIQGSSQGHYVDALPESPVDITELTRGDLPSHISKLKKMLEASQRPICLIGGGVSRNDAPDLIKFCEKYGIPVQTTWNGADRVDSRHRLYFGRPNTWGQRYANLIIQQSDLLIAVGTRLGLQQTGFNWKEFLPLGDIFQVDIDLNELNKGHPFVETKVNSDSSDFIQHINEIDFGLDQSRYFNWLEFCSFIKAELPLSEKANEVSNGFVNTYEFYLWLATRQSTRDILIPSSSGASETVAMQTFGQSGGTRIATSKGMASMGYGLAAAIGASFTGAKRVLHVEGDGSLSQNLQEFGTVAINNLPIKSFILANEGYASIRMTQQNYFNGRYMGCDTNTGLGLPSWEMLAMSYRIPYLRLDTNYESDLELDNLLNMDGPAIIEVPVDPKQTYFPKISSTINKDTGQAISNPLHSMTPPLDDSTLQLLAKYLHLKGTTE